jgi:hypothetical protein
MSVALPWKPKPKTMKRRRESFFSLIRKLDRIFSEYIRRRDSVGGYCTCITCGAVKPWREMDCGHYIGRKHYVTRFDERNCHTQCKRCNNWGEGEKPLYRGKLVALYGEKEVQCLEDYSQIVGSETCESVKYKIIEYQKKLQRLKEGKGV